MAYMYNTIITNTVGKISCDFIQYYYMYYIGSSSTLEPPPYENDEREGVEQEVGGEEEEFDESGDLFSGAKEFESYKQVQSIKKKIQFNLGRRSGPRWSLPFGT